MSRSATPRLTVPTSSHSTPSAISKPRRWVSRPPQPGESGDPDQHGEHHDPGRFDRESGRHQERLRRLIEREAAGRGLFEDADAHKVAQYSTE